MEKTLKNKTSAMGSLPVSAEDSADPYKQYQIPEKLARELALREQRTEIDRELKALCPDPAKNDDISQEYETFVKSLPEMIDINNKDFQRVNNSFASLQNLRAIDRLERTSLLLKGNQMTRDEIRQLLGSVR